MTEAYQAPPPPPMHRLEDKNTLVIMVPVIQKYAHREVYTLIMIQFMTMIAVINMVSHHQGLNLEVMLFLGGLENSNSEPLMFLH